MVQEIRQKKAERRERNQMNKAKAASRLEKTKYVKIERRAQQKNGHIAYAYGGLIRVKTEEDSDRGQDSDFEQE